MNSVIKVENISKQYRLGKVGTGTLRDDIKVLWASIMGKQNPFLNVGETNDRAQKSNSNYVWALKNINFDVESGEVLGIIGRNGAGKSTLLKILSRVTSPTSGQIKSKGKIASLLEVGTGFHPDLTGRENIFLNGAILGMNRVEVSNKLEEIIAFSGVEKYIDTPVKRYSSGMYVRLAFAVAAHLEPEILIIDEVLAVGDSEFQKKCLGKMKDVSKQGRTVIFVSHNMGAVQNLCDTVIVMKNGNIEHPKLPSQEGISLYNQMMIEKTQTQLNDRIDRTGNGKLRFIQTEWLDSSFNLITNPLCGTNVIMKITLDSLLDEDVNISIGINNLNGDSVALLSTSLTNTAVKVNKSENVIYCRIDKFPISPGMYLINLYAESNEGILDWVQEAAILEVESGDYFGTGKSIPPSHQSVCINHQWLLK